VAMSGKSSLVVVVNENITIERACRMAGVSVPDMGPDIRSLKLHCPFEDTHEDSEPAFRVYPGTNSAYCFGCQRGWSPVRLCAEVWEVTREEAAARMAQQAGITQPGWRDRFHTLATAAPEVGLHELGEALKTFCAGLVPGEWDRLQFHPAVADGLAYCLGLLPLVQTEAEGKTWLRGCKHAMCGLITDTLSKEETHGARA
jgi:CHC2 zinc finger